MYSTQNLIVNSCCDKLKSKNTGYHYHKAVIPSSFTIRFAAWIIPEYFDENVLPFT